MLFSNCLLRNRFLVLCSSAKKMHSLKEKAFVNGEWIGSGNQKSFDVINPSTLAKVGSVPALTVEDAEKAIEAAYSAFQKWQLTTAKERAGLLRKWYELLVKNSDEISKVMTAESGKPLIESQGEVTYGNSFVEFYSEEARRIKGEILQSPVPDKKILVEKQPIGVAALITPWNFPHAMITRKASAALASGCTVLVKPAEDTPLTALLLADLAQAAGFPKGVFNVITCARDNAGPIGNLLCQSPLVAGISFTGSTEVGKILYKQCSSGIKRLGLELGGNAPFIVFNSANISKAIKGAMASKFRNCGQTCIASNRFYVQEKIYEEFVDEFAKAIKGLKQGDGTCEGVTVGPLINQAQFNKVKNMVEDAISHGAKVVVGGKPASNLGPLFFQPTLITNVNEKMIIFNDEIFGPIASVKKFSTEEEAMKIANRTRRGLASYVYSEDIAQIFRVSKGLEAGMVGVNEGLISMAEAPFGGVKESGLGREGSHHGIDDFTYIKYICIGNL